MPAREDELGVLWLKEAQASGKKYMSGRLTIGDESVAVVVFKNEYKQEGERTPDYRVYRSQPRQDTPTRNAERGQGTHDRSRDAQSCGFDDLDDEIPF